MSTSAAINKGTNTHWKLLLKCKYRHHENSDFIQPINPPDVAFLDVDFEDSD
jgi:hypothetical protein